MSRLICYLARPTCVNKSLNKSGWIMSSGFGGDSIKVELTDWSFWLLPGPLGGWQKEISFCMQNLWKKVFQQRGSFKVWKFNDIMLIYCLLRLVPLKMFKVRKVAKIRNQYNQVPHLTQNTTYERDKNTIKHHKREPIGQPFPSRWPQGSNEQTRKHDKHKT